MKNLIAIISFLIITTQIFAQNQNLEPRMHIECSSPESNEHYTLDLSEKSLVMGYVYGIGTEDEYRLSKPLFQDHSKESKKAIVFTSFDPKKQIPTHPIVETFTLKKQYLFKALAAFDMNIHIKNIESGRELQFTWFCHSSIF